ncbi:MAG: ABC transporter permease [Chloroflexi bacterium]|nr:ABC transporter permease [Chloroflexota bacterium]
MIGEHAASASHVSQTGGTALAASGGLTREEVAARRRQRQERILTVGSPIALILLWEGLARAGVLDTRFFPAPSSIVQSLGGLLQSGELVADLRDTLTRVFVGVLLGGIPGLIIGAIMGLSPTVRAFLKPIVAALFPIPKLAVLPLIFLIFGLGEQAKYVSVSIGIVFLMLINTMAGVMAIDRIYFDVGKNFGASRWQFFRTIAVPGAMPGILTGFQLSLTIALLVCVATEFVGAKSGLGFLIWNSWQTFSVAAMYSGLLVCAILGLVFQVAIDLVERVLIPWKPR